MVFQENPDDDIEGKSLLMVVEYRKYYTMLEDAFYTWNAVVVVVNSVFYFL